MVKLFKQAVSRNGADYTDLYATWTYQGKVYLVRVRPVFGRDNDKLMAIAEEVPTGEVVQKYI